MIEEIIIHEAVITLRMRLGQPHVFIHVKGYDVAEADFTGLVEFDQTLVGLQRCAAGRQAQHKRALGSRLERIDALDDMTGRPQTNVGRVMQRNKSHRAPFTIRETGQKAGSASGKTFHFLTPREGNVSPPFDFSNDKISFR